MQIVLASNNIKKLAELKEILSPLGIDLITAREAGALGEPEENGETFRANARIKAWHAMQATGMPAIADDSGLAVDALSGAPGVRSARYAEGDDAARTAKLLQALSDVPAEKRTARFISAVACLFPDGREIYAEGSCEGVIAFAPSGSGGFGYDPVFYVPGLGKTFAELSPLEKNGISHRGRALAVLTEKLKGIGIC